MCAVPVIAAFAAYLFWTPESGSNYGRLVGPTALPDVPGRSSDGSPFRLSDLKGKWTLVQIDGGRCGEACGKRLFFMRQVRLMQGREAPRVERLWIIDDEAVPDSETLQGQEGLRVVRGGELARVFTTRGQAGGTLFLVDPLGNLVLSFPPDPDPTRVSRDLSRLLRVSHIG